MLTKKEITSLPKGTYPNGLLRSKFGVKHGSVVKDVYKENDEFKVREIIGNRRQRKWRLKHPIGEFQYDEKPTYFPTTTYFPTKKKNIGWVGKVMKFFAKLFGAVSLVMMVGCTSHVYKHDAGPRYQPKIEIPNTIK